jgi:exodeoxyribonuclease III
MKLLSWNVNGIRAIFKKGFVKWLETEMPDVLCLQEIKIDNDAIGKKEFDFPGYSEFYHPADRKGYSGTAILIKNEELKIKNYFTGFGKKGDDKEGRVQTIEFDEFYLVNCYFPNANHELSRLKFKLDFNDKLLKYLKSLEKSKPVVICGDYNVAHNEIDLARPKDNVGNPGFTDEERAWMTKFLNSGFKDTFREKHPYEVKYSWWSYRTRARVKNVGWRIDYFSVSDKIMKNVKQAFILDQIQGSDHCPVGIVI